MSRPESRLAKSRTTRPAAAKGDSAKSRAGGPDGLMEMDEAISFLKTTRPTFYRWLRSGKVRGLKVGRQWRFRRPDLERFLDGQGPRVDLRVSIGPLVEALAARAREAGVRDDPAPGADQVARAVRLMIGLAVAGRASDIHLTPHLFPGSAQSVAVLRLRIDGLLQEAARFDVRLLPAVIEGWKRQTACDLHEKDRPQDGRVVLKASEFVGSPQDRVIDLRSCFLPTALGESLTARLLAEVSSVSLQLDRIGYAAGDLERIQRALEAPWGLILATGPTGSGKTTALYSCLMRLAAPERKIVSVEDPIEYLLPWTTQVAVKESAGLTFARAMRAILRSDPDVILVGEIRDRESLLVAQQAVLTGHLVLTTLHTEEAAGALRRMVDMGGEPFLVADSTRLVISQRLLRRLCPECGREAAPAQELLDRAAQAARLGGVELERLPGRFREPVGCAKCARTGFRGRLAAAEVLEMTPEIGAALRRGAALDELRGIAVGQGMTTMAADGLRRAAEGQTSLAEVARCLGLR